MDNNPWARFVCAYGMDIEFDWNSSLLMPFLGLAVMVLPWAGVVKAVGAGRDDAEDRLQAPSIVDFELT